jgi:hypothetical protein
MNEFKSTEPFSYKTAIHIFIYTVVLILLVFMITKSAVRDIKTDKEINNNVQTDADNYSNR